MRLIELAALLILVALLSLVAPTSQTQAAPPSVSVDPPLVVLEGRFDRAQLLVTQSAASSATQVDSMQGTDLTHQAKYLCVDESVARVSSSGRITAIASGTTTVQISIADRSYDVPVTVIERSDEPIDFVKDIRPILAKAGCASAACHASQYGKGGFKLSVFGFDPDSDYDAIVRSSRGRRVSIARPDASLLLSKASMRAEHGGGLRFASDSVEYQTLQAWIRSGAAPSTQSDLSVRSLAVYPSKRIGEPGFTQQLRIVAEFSDGSQRDVTATAYFESLDGAIATVDSDGLVQAIGMGQTAVMVRYEGQVAVSTFVIPFRKSVELTGWKSNNFVDEFASQKFHDLGLQPSPVCDDATFIRRAFLDCIGSLPPAGLVREFVTSDAADKREKLVDRLLGLTGDSSLDTFGDRYAAFWTLRWSDLIRNNSNELGEQGMWALHNWIKESFRTNKPYDQFVRELVTAQGSIYSNGPANYYRINSNSSELTEATSQLFLGVRLECAKCHHHPFEVYGQDDYYSMAAFFSRVSSKTSEEFGLFGRETIVTVRATGEVSHPRTNQRMHPTPLGGEATDNDLDRRIPLAQWLTDHNNEYFAKSVVNRYMKYLLGRGLVDPVDDMRSTNPPSNTALMDALAKDFVEHHYDLKHLIRTIMTSRIYGLSSSPTEANQTDDRFYSHFLVKRLAAEPLLDAVDDATGVQTKYRNLPLGTRAIELPDAEYPNYFLNTFAKPHRVSVCECERSTDANLAQALHTFNGDTITKKVADKNGRVMKSIAEKTPHNELVTDLYLATVCRFPSEAELDYSRKLLEESESAEVAYQDLLWALINSKQFLFVH